MLAPGSRCTASFATEIRKSCFAGFAGAIVAARDDYDGVVHATWLEACSRDQFPVSAFWPRDRNLELDTYFAATGQRHEDDGRVRTLPLP